MDDELRCPSCGTDERLAGERDVRTAAQAVLEKSRGTQLSIVSVNTVYLCPRCDADKLERVRESNTPLPPDDNPAAGMR